jgi:hypothetical protein
LKFVSGLAPPLPFLAPFVCGSYKILPLFITTVKTEDYVEC